MLEISIDSKFPYFTMTTTIENIAYQLEFIWNERQERWRMSILDMKDNYILKNLKLVPWMPMTKRYRLQNIYKGDFVGVDTKANVNMPQRDNLGTDFKLFYFSREELKESGLDQLL